LTVPALCALLAVLVGCAPSRPADLSPAADKAGVMVMAHGGEPEWNATVQDAVAPLRSWTPVVVAFGMAVPDSLQRAVRELEAEGVTQIAVVRLFVSAASFRHRTEYILGVRPDPPPPYDRSEHGVAPIERAASIVINEQGLSQSPRIGMVLAARVAALSSTPPQESVLILAHGMGDDRTNDVLVSDIDRLADQVRALGPFRAVQVETLREDWDEKRPLAEQRIRGFVEAGSRDSGRVIVVPFRVSGFGPYRDVLEGLDYVADGVGLLPHPQVSAWIEEQAGSSFRRAGWVDPIAGNR
jgi:sirohydrochlorin ferrochelatase